MHDAGGDKSLLKSLRELCESKELKIAVKSIHALGYWAGSEKAQSGGLAECVEILLSMHNRKEDQIQFAVGEALCFAYGGMQSLQYTPHSPFLFVAFYLWSSFCHARTLLSYARTLLS